jgi:hypothetical protein
MKITRTHVAATQGAVFIASGLWPVIHLRSFERASGPKVDGWLVKTVGLLLASVGGGLFAAAMRRRVTGELAAVGALTAASLVAIDLRFAPTGRIPRRYLADALLHSLWLVGWGLAKRSPQHSRE